MSNSESRRIHGLSGKRTKERRPQGVSRRRKKQFGFETLEDRRVMADGSPVGPYDFTPLSGGAASYSASSATAAGQADILARELYWQSLIAAAAGTPASLTALSIPTDPLLSQQWHLMNSGQQVGNPDYQSIFGKPGEDINVAPVWNQGYTGSGVRVGVIDSGVELNHPDLIANLDRGMARDFLSTIGDGNPNFTLTNDFHGTAVAGIIGAVANNGIGGAGVAPGTTLVPMRLISPAGGDLLYPFPDTDVAAAFRYSREADLDITNNSWGRGGFFGRTLTPFTDYELLALRDSIIFGREGKGVIHVFASGNDAGNTFNGGFTDIGTFDSASYGITNSRYVITVGGVDHDGSYNNIDGTVTNYPEAGANVLVVAPTGSFARIDIADDTGVGSGIVTTDIGGNLGINHTPDRYIDPFTGILVDDRDFLENFDYTSRMNGTSAAAPMVSGVVALMLEANPNLTWRDVQEILVRSARQNAEFEVPGQGSGVETQNTWIVNQVPLFHDPDLFDPTIPISSTLRTRRPTLDPNASVSIFGGLTSRVGGDHYVAAPFQMTNGAGYTVSQGIGVYGEQVGYGHGVVDADLAVKMAQQWHTKNQALPSELTFTSFVAHPGTPLNLPAAEKGSEDSGYQVVPGGIDGESGFIAYWNEYFVDDPDFSQDFPYRGDEAMEFEVPANNAMSVETVELKIHLTGNAAEAMEHLRITLISPEGTHSELNHYIVDSHGAPQSFQWLGLTEAHPYIGSFGTTDPSTGEFIWTFTTNRSWGERSDNAIVFDPVTGEPVLDETGILNSDLLTGEFGPTGVALERGWRVVLENWDANDSFALADLELAFHGSPVQANSQRVQGFVGLDDNRDDLFNFSRVVQQTVNLDGDPAITRLGEVVTEVDLAQESFAANVTVNVHRVSDGALVDQFVTGHDGNFYFDLVPDDYIVTVDDPEGRVAQDDTITAGGLLRHYQSSWRITPEMFNVWSKVTGNPSETPLDANGLPQLWTDGNGQTQEYGVRGVNFLLDPGDPPVQQVSYSGTIYADTNGDGAFNSVDVVLPNVNVFADANRNGQRDAGEVMVTTGANGQYNLVVPLTTQGVMNVGVIVPVQWTISSPAARVHTRFVQPGDSFSGLDFYLTPPANNAVGGALPGIIMGSVFNDANNNGAREAAETGVPNFTVYIDANNNGIVDAGDTTTTTNQFGSYVFANVAPGAKAVRVVTPSPFQQTSPANNLARNLNLLGSSTISGVTFGIRDTAQLDYGDLPGAYGMTLLGENGARHRKGAYYLGSRVDGELEGNPTTDANGDDLFGLPDEDGIQFGTLAPGGTASITVTASRNNGYLKGWVDWNNNGNFNDPGERLIFSGIGAASNNVLLAGGANQLFFSIPAGLTFDNVFARFRYGEATIDSPVGLAQIGEVEDYKLSIVIPTGSVVTGVPADFNQSGSVDGADFLSWQRNFARTTQVTQANGNANGDGIVNGADLTLWEQQFGTTSQTATASAALMAADESSAGSNATFALSAQTVLDGALATRLAEAANGLDRPTSAAARLREIAERIDQRFERVGDKAAEVLNRVADRLDAAGRDEAFDHLFRGRLRPNHRGTLETATSGGVDEADEAFAAMAQAM